ncbi:hypothetical protein J6590_093124 [Homalodisca vitripennis]|nr:hypothetical protein J6590_093124 [Homalodisca vitripennis]
MSFLPVQMLYTQHLENEPAGVTCCMKLNLSISNTEFDCSVHPGPSNKGCTILTAGVTPWSRDRIRHEPDVCRVYPLATMGALWFTRYYTSVE